MTAGANSTLIVDGTFTSTQYCATTSGNFTLTVGEFGTLTSVTGKAIDLNTTGFKQITNAGTIMGYGSGIGISSYSIAAGLRFDILNSGKILGNVNGIYAAVTSGTSNLTNSGEITGGDVGVIVTGQSGATVEYFNTGTISGSIEAIRGFGGVDIVDNRGILNGNVALHHSDDRFDSRWGTVNGNVDGGDGDDTLLGSQQDDEFLGGADNDVLQGRKGDDTLSGGDGDDEIKGGQGDDSLLGGNGADTLSGGKGADTMEGGTGDDRYVVDNTGDVVTEGVGEGTDVVASSRINLDLSDYQNVENLELIGSRDLKATGDAGSNVIAGNAGANVLIGNDGDDLLSGGDGADVLNGDAGDDTLIGGAGSDTLLGGFRADQLSGGAGDDELRGGLGADDLTGGDGSDLLFGGDGSDVLRGGAMSDTLQGGSGADVLLGGGGADRLEGELGSDTLTGGTGADHFLFKSVADSGPGTTMRDLITVLDQGSDLIDVQGVAGFTFIAAGVFSNSAGELRYSQVSSTTIVQGDIDGDGSADFEIAFDGLINLTVGDFIL